jgi:hypothetical protein
VQPGASCEGARAERAVPVDEIKAIQVDVLEINAGADMMVEQGQLDAQLAQRLLDRGYSAAVCAATSRCSQILLNSYDMILISSEYRRNGAPPEGVPCTGKGWP